MDAAEVLQRYFAETIGGDLDAVDRYFVVAPDYVLITEDDHELGKLIPWAGRQTDRAGIKHAYGSLLQSLEVLEARPGVMSTDREHVSVDGVFRYRARATGKEVTSAWAAHATIQDGRIARYRFYENSYAVAAALQPG
jgi:ketosteroid isomerase-like protein